ncbi:MAG: hypothetical protein U5L04_01180 [Trueperaceae bacterium]|nr:hypothetical protein [Trueperaceae bacterium]
MASNRGPSYHEWCDVLAHTSNYSFDELKAISERIEEKEASRLSTAQRADLLQRLGDLQIAAARREERLSA